MGLQDLIAEKLRPYPLAYHWARRGFQAALWLPNLIAGKLLSYDTLYRLSLRGATIGKPLNHPQARPFNAVLQSEAEWREAVAAAKSLGLPLHGDPPKNWDSLIALDAILRNTSPAAHVLDAGAELYSRLLPSLFLYGYRHLYGINLTFTRPLQRGPIRYSYGDITKTDFPANTFDAIACLSVIEHGVEPEAYLRETHRILKPGGLLITSTDYWPQGVDTRGLTAYDTPVKVFTAAEVRHMLALAESLGFRPMEPVPLQAGEPCITWRGFPHRYTFLVMTLRKG